MDASDLYGLPLESFTPERNAVTKRLRGEGRRAEAATVAKLRKPSVSAWAVNQLVRTQKREVAALFEAGDALRKAQADLLAGRVKPGELRQAVEAEREALDRLMDRARGLLSAEGHGLTQATLEQVAETLHAAALETEAREHVREGRLERELRHIGLGAMAPPEPGKAPARSGVRSKPPRASASDAPEVGEAERRRTKPRTAATTAARAEADARRALARSAQRAKAAQERLERAAEELAAAEAKVSAARERAEEAQREHARRLGELRQREG